MDGNDRLVILALIVATLVLSFLFMLPERWSEILLSNDEMWHADLARNIYAGNGFTSDTLYPMQARRVDSWPVQEPFKQSGYALLTAFFWLFTGPTPRVMLLISMLCTALIPAAVYVLGKRIFGDRRAAAVLAGLSILNPRILWYYTATLPESLFSIAFLLLVLVAIRPSSRAAAIAGGGTAVLMIIKGYGLIYIPVFALYFFLTGGRERLRRAAIYLSLLVVVMVSASLVLPAGSIQTFRAGGGYAYAFLFETGRYPTVAVPYGEIDPEQPWEYILAHPVDYGVKVAKQFRRTKLILENVGGPAMGGVLLPLLLFSGVSLGWAAWGGGRTGNKEREPPARTETSDEDVLVRWRDQFLLFAGLLGMSLMFLWSLYIKTYYLYHLYPLMLMLIFGALSTWWPQWSSLPRRYSRTVAALALLFFLVYPGAAALWDVHRHPRIYFSRLHVIHFLDFDEMAAAVSSRVPPDAVVVSDMAHEVSWLAGNRTIAMPHVEAALPYLVEKYDVEALLEHPTLFRDWAYIAENFVLVDTDNGRLWIRK